MAKNKLRTCGRKGCNPAFRMTGGADHFGVDVFVRCLLCDRRTETHVECIAPNDRVHELMAIEWKRELAA